MSVLSRIYPGDACAFWIRTLLELSQSLGSVSPKPAALGLFHCRWRLEDRIAGLLDRRRETMIGVSRWTVGMSAILFLTVAGLVASVRVAQATPNESSAVTPAPVSPIPPAMGAQAARRLICVRVVGPEGKPMAKVKIHAGVWTKEPFKANRDYVTDAAERQRWNCPGRSISSDSGRGRMAMCPCSPSGGASCNPTTIGSRRSLPSISEKEP